MKTITIEFLRSYPALQQKSEEQLNRWLTMLKDQGVETTADLDNVDRKGLLEAGIPLLVAEALKPEKPENGHLNRSTSVFVLYSETESGPDPIATAFAVSDSLLMTAAHNIVKRGEDDDQIDIEQVEDAKEQEEQKEDFVDENLMIASALHKDFNGTITAENPRKVTLAKYHYHHDWAFLKVCADAKLEHFIPVATTPDELPLRGTLEKMYIYHCPVRIFQELNRGTTVHAMPKEVSVGTVDKQFLSFQNGGFRGSCGGPYVFRNKAIALHVESSNEAVAFEMLEEKEIVVRGRKRKMTQLEKTLEVAESTVSSHTSLGTGLILQQRSGLMKVYTGEIET